MPPELVIIIFLVFCCTSIPFAVYVGCRIYDAGVDSVEKEAIKAGVARWIVKENNQRGMQWIGGNSSSEESSD